MGNRNGRTYIGTVEEVATYDKTVADTLKEGLADHRSTVSILQTIIYRLAQEKRKLIIDMRNEVEEIKEGLEDLKNERKNVDEN